MALILFLFAAFLFYIRGWTLIPVAFLFALLLFYMEGWAIIPIALILLGTKGEHFESHQRRKKSEEPPTPDRQLTGLVLLRLALKRLHQVGNLKTSRYQEISDKIDGLYAERCGQLGLTNSRTRALLESTKYRLDKHPDWTLPWHLILDFKLSDITPQIDDKPLALPEIQAQPVPSTDTPSFENKKFDLPEIQAQPEPEK